VERLQDIDVCGAVASGIEPARRLPCGGESHDPIQEFLEQWNAAHPDYPWESNPWTWVLTLEAE